jgi:hypothetical protein
MRVVGGRNYSVSVAGTTTVDCDAVGASGFVFLSTLATNLVRLKIFAGDASSHFQRQCVVNHQFAFTGVNNLWCGGSTGAFLDLVTDAAETVQGRLWLVDEPLMPFGYVRLGGAAAVVAAAGTLNVLTVDDWGPVRAVNIITQTQRAASILLVDSSTGVQPTATVRAITAAGGGFLNLVEVFPMEGVLNVRNDDGALTNDIRCNVYASLGF